MTDTDFEDIQEYDSPYLIDDTNYTNHLSHILDTNGRRFYTGLAQPITPGLTGFSRVRDSIPLLSDADVKAIITDTSWVPAEQEFDDHWVIEGDQTQHNSCGGWGGTNGFSKMRWRLGIRDGIVFSGSYLYSWGNRGSDQGAVLEEIMQYLMTKGTVPKSTCGPNTIWRQQCSAFDGEAVNHEGLALQAIANQAELNTVLAQKKIATVCVQVDSSQYCNYKGQGLVPAFRGNGNHCIHCDDIRWNSVASRYEYRQVGNWNVTWGLRGTGWCTFASFGQTIANHMFYAHTSVKDMKA